MWCAHPVSPPHPAPRVCGEGGVGERAEDAHGAAEDVPPLPQHTVEDTPAAHVGHTWGGVRGWGERMGYDVLG